MSDVIMRSRAAMWSAFHTPEGPVLNIRDKSGRLVSVALDADDVAALASPDATDAHRRADHLAEHGPRLAEAVPTPSLGQDEPPSHESRQSENDLRRSLRLAA